MGILHDFAHRFNIQLNTSKTEYISNISPAVRGDRVWRPPYRIELFPEEDFKITYEGQEIKQVEKFKYSKAVSKQ